MDGSGNHRVQTVVHTLICLVSRDTIIPSNQGAVLSLVGTIRAVDTHKSTWQFLYPSRPASKALLLWSQSLNVSDALPLIAQCHNPDESHRHPIYSPGHGQNTSILTKHRLLASLSRSNSYGSYWLKGAPSLHGKAMLSDLPHSLPHRHVLRLFW